MFTNIEDMIIWQEKIPKSCRAIYVFVEGNPSMIC